MLRLSRVFTVGLAIAGMALCALTAVASADTIIGYDDAGYPIYDTPNYTARICGDINAPDSTYVRNNLRDLAPRLLLRQGRDSFDVRGYGYRNGDPNSPDGKWLRGTGHSATEGDYVGWVAARSVTTTNGYCVS